MARELSDEQKAKMQAGRERWAEEEARLREERTAAFQAWVREDARLWGIYAASEGPERVEARRVWAANLRAIPETP